MSDFVYRNGRYQSWPDAPEFPDCPEEGGNLAESMGYFGLEHLELGAAEAGFWVLINERDEERTDLRYQFLVELHVSGELRFVWVPDIANLLQLLQELSPIATAALASLKYRKETVHVPLIGHIGRTYGPLDEEP